MTTGLFVAGAGSATGRSAVALGVHRLLAGRVGRIGVFRPVVDAPDGRLRGWDRPARRGVRTAIRAQAIGAA